MPRPFLLSVMACLALAPCLAAGAQETDRTLLRPNLIEVAHGRRLHFACVGEGSPTIVFEQGGEGWIVNWRKVQEEAARISRTCFYDRAGFGLSDPAEDPVTGNNVTDDLKSLLVAAHVAEPVVLVGHSIGGFYATLFADRFPQSVAGLVLIEPGFDGQFGPSSPRQRRQEQGAMRAGAEGLRNCAELARRNNLSPEQTHASDAAAVTPKDGSP